MAKEKIPRDLKVAEIRVCSRNRNHSLGRETETSHRWGFPKSMKRALNVSMEIGQQLLAFTQASIIRNKAIIQVILTWQGSPMDQFWEWHPHSATRLNTVFEASELKVFNRSRQRYWSALPFVPYDYRTGQMSAAFVWEPVSASLSRINIRQTEQFKRQRKPLAVGAEYFGTSTKLTPRLSFLCWGKIMIRRPNIIMKESRNEWWVTMRVSLCPCYLRKKGSGKSGRSIVAEEGFAETNNRRWNDINQVRNPTHVLVSVYRTLAMLWILPRA